MVLRKIPDQFGNGSLGDIVVLFEGEAFHIVLENGLPIVLREDELDRVQLTLKYILDLRSAPSQKSGFVEELREAFLQLLHPSENVGIPRLFKDFVISLLSLEDAGIL